MDTRLILLLHGTPYTLERLGSGWRLQKGDGTTYDCWQDSWGWHCDCGDFVFRKENTPAAECKHLRGLIDVGLIEGNR